jgi:tRNA A37 methylthiotransferase MiaB
VDKKGIGFKRCKMSKAFKVITLGCKVNQYESAYLEESLLSKGCRKLGADGSADLVIINTCIVTARAGNQKGHQGKSWSNYYGYGLLWPGVSR